MGHGPNPISNNPRAPLAPSPQVKPKSTSREERARSMTCFHLSRGTNGRKIVAIVLRRQATSTRRLQPAKTVHPSPKTGPGARAAERSCKAVDSRAWPTTRHQFSESCNMSRINKQPSYTRYSFNTVSKQNGISRTHCIETENSHKPQTSRFKDSRRKLLDLNPRGHSGF